MNEENKIQIDKELLKESLAEYTHLAELIEETKRNSYAAILAESEEDDNEDNSGDFEVEQVEDTASNESGTEDDSDENDDASDIGSEAAETGDTSSKDDGMESAEDETVEEDGTEDGAWTNEFGDYKVSDGEYDLTSAQDDTVVKVYKLLKDTDGITVVKDDDRLEIKDGENEYIIQLDSTDESAPSNQGEDEIEIELQDDTNMKESTERVFEVLINEYDSHVGYTDNYQSKDVMTTDGVKEPGNGRDIDKGVPHTNSKPWANPDKKAKPFDKGVKGECGINADAPLEEQSIARVGKRRMKGVKSPVPDTSGQDHPYNPSNKTVAGEYKGSKRGVDESKVIESYKQTIAECKKMIADNKKMVEENKKLKATLSKVTNMVKEAAVTNMNLGSIVKLITENSTTSEEKKQIVSRFVNEAKTVTESQNLYQQISNELKAKPQNAVNINEEKQFTAKENEVINESEFYRDESLANSLGLMNRICK